MTDDELLNHLYHVKKNYGGAKQLYDKAKIQHPKITFKIVDKWLKDQASYQLNKEELIEVHKQLKLEDKKKNPKKI